MHNPAREVFHAGFVIKHNVGVFIGDHFERVFQHVIGVAVATGALGTTHRDQIKIFGLNKAFGNFQLQHLLFGNSSAHAFGGLFARIFSNPADAFFYVNAEVTIETGVWIGIDGKNRRFPARDQAPDNQSGQGCFSHAAFSTNSNDIAHKIDSS